MVRGGALNEVVQAALDSEASWTKLLNHVKVGGFKVYPHLAIGDGASGFWAVVRKVFTKIREQCF